MARYDYECIHCHHVWEENRPITDPIDDDLFCPVCKCTRPVSRHINKPAIQFKGDGFPGNDLKRRGPTRPIPEST